MHVNVYKSINEIQKSEWDSIIKNNNILNSYNYLKTIELSELENFKFYYFMFYKNNKLIGHTFITIITFNFDLMAKKGFQSFISFCRKFIPTFLIFKFIECGHPTALGNAITLISQDYFEELLINLDREILKLLKLEKARFIAIRDIFNSDLEKYDFLKKLHYKSSLTLANTFFKVSQKSFNEYLNDLVSKRRHEILNRLNKFEKENCKIEKITDFRLLSDQLLKLWTNTYKNSTEFQREILTKKYFENFSSIMNKKSFILLCKKDDKIIGFTMLLDNGKTLISTYTGLDYNYNKQTYAYFILFYKSIEEAINLKKKWLELGITNYNPKIEIGAVPEPMYVYLKSNNIIINIFLSKLFSLIRTPINTNKRKIFNNRYFEREKIKSEIYLFINTKQYKLKDISLEGFSIESDTKLKKNKYLCKILIENDFPILLNTRIKNISFTKNHKYRIGMKITNIIKENYLHWHYFVQQYNLKK